jgi:hypothetical protein
MPVSPWNLRAPAPAGAFHWKRGAGRFAFDGYPGRRQNSGDSALHYSEGVRLVCLTPAAPEAAPLSAGWSADLRERSMVMEHRSFLVWWQRFNDEWLGRNVKWSDLDAEQRLRWVHGVTPSIYSFVEDELDPANGEIVNLGYFLVTERLCRSVVSRFRVGGPAGKRESDYQVRVYRDSDAQELLACASADEAIMGELRDYAMFNPTMDAVEKGLMTRMKTAWSRSEKDPRPGEWWMKDKTIILCSKCKSSLAEIVVVNDTPREKKARGECEDWRYRVDCPTCGRDTEVT